MKTLEIAQVATKMKRKRDTEEKYKLGEEELFQDYFKGNYEDALPGCILIASEYPLYGAYKILTRDFSPGTRGKGCIGRIDFIFRYKQKNYIAEAKYYPFQLSEFWGALKVVGYTEYYKWQTEKSDFYLDTEVLMRQ